MAILHVKSPNGTTHTVNLVNMNIERYTASTWGYVVLPGSFKIAIEFGNTYTWEGAANGEIYFPPPIEFADPPFCVVATTDANTSSEWRHRVEYIGLSANQLGFYVSAQKDDFGEGDSRSQCFSYIAIGHVV